MFKVSYALERKFFITLLPARFLLGRKKGRAKSHVYYLDLLAHPLGGF